MAVGTAAAAAAAAVVVEAAALVGIVTCSPTADMCSADSVVVAAFQEDTGGCHHSVVLVGDTAGTELLRSSAGC